jgi:hypothetical protein
MPSYALAVLALSALVALHADPEPCKLLTVAEITAALGKAPEAGTPRGPEVDQALQVKGWACDRVVGEYHLSIDVFEFASPSVAAQGIATMRELAKGGDPFPLEPVSGERDPALWGSSDEGAIWAVSRGQYIVTITLAGNLRNPAALRDPLKRLAGAAVGRL